MGCSTVHHCEDDAVLFVILGDLLNRKRPDAAGNDELFLAGSTNCSKNQMTFPAQSLMSDIDTWKASLEEAMKLHATSSETRLDYILEHTKSVEVIVLAQLKDCLFDLSECPHWELASLKVR